MQCIEYLHATVDEEHTEHCARISLYFYQQHSPQHTFMLDEENTVSVYLISSILQRISVYLISSILHRISVYLKSSILHRISVYLISSKLHRISLHLISSILHRISVYLISSIPKNQNIPNIP